MPEKILLKDALFNRKKVERIAGEIRRAYPAFRAKDFVRDVLERFPTLELKARIAWIAECLEARLPDDFRSATGILVEALPPPSRPDLSDNDFGEFIYAPYSEFIARNGCSGKHLRFSLDALHQMTQRFSAEDSIRTFINAFPQETLREIMKWTGDPHYHVRRLCSEGTRPKLPWARKIDIPVDAALPILDRLFSDKTRFVTRSVANHINDISKIDPDAAMDALERWKKSGRQKPEEMGYIIRHGLRTLIKQGNPKAMKVIGLSTRATISVSGLRVPAKARMNTALEFSFTVEAGEDAEVIIDYALYFRNKAGKLGGRKVFKLTRKRLGKSGPVVISKRHMLREHMTTRTLYPGQHEIEIQVNGKICAKGNFDLVKPRQGKNA